MGAVCDRQAPPADGALGDAVEGRSRSEGVAAANDGVVGRSLRTGVVHGDVRPRDGPSDPNAHDRRGAFHARSLRRLRHARPHSSAAGEQIGCSSIRARQRGSDVARRSLSVAVLVLLGALLLAPAATPKATSTTIRVTALDTLRFKLSKMSAPAGKVVFNVKNGGSLSHDFRIGGKATKLLGGGQSSTLTVTLKKGKYPYKCTVPGHAAAGMRGTFTVK